MKAFESRRWSTLVIVALAIAACQGATSSPSSAEPPEAATGSPPASAAPSTEPTPSKPFDGEEITLQTYAGTPVFDYYKTLMPDFEARTGIRVNYVQLPIAGMDQKVPLQLSAKDDGLDVFFTGSENIGSYIGIDGVEPLDAYLNDQAQTPESYAFGDIAPAVQSACQNGGQNWCIAAYAGGGILYYNTRLYQEAGITAPPQNPTELSDYAKRLTNDDHAGFCVRGDKTQNLYTAFMLWQWFYEYNNPVTGNYFDEEWNFLLGTEPRASEFGSWFRDITQSSAPSGIATYLATNCLEDFQQGRVAMWYDSEGFIKDVLDPEKSRVSGETAFHSLPCQPVNPDHCALVQPFGTWMNAASKHKGAAWQLIQFLTSAEAQRMAALEGALLTPSRLSVLADPEVVASFPPTFAETITHVFEHPNVALLPFIPEGVAILPPMLNNLNNLIATDDPVDRIMADMKAGVDDIMSDAGYPKPFPEY